MERCAWCGSSKLMTDYHDREWGTPLHDDRKLFEFLILEGAQAGLAWQSVLNKRENYRRGFDNFDPKKIAKYNQKDIKLLLKNAGIIRNRLKIEAAVSNAKKFLDIQKEFGSFDTYIWQFVDYKPIKNKFSSSNQIPAATKESKSMSKDLEQRGFRFVGPTICYAFMQAVGMVNDHTTKCFRYNEIQWSRRK